MNNKFRWAIVGCGGIVNVVIPQIIASGKHEITAVYNRSRKRGEECVARFGGRYCENAVDAVKADDVDAVYIGTANNMHKEFIELCLNNKKAVLCEKPITANAKEASELFALARANNTYFAEGMWTLYNNTAKRVKKWIDDGEIGDVIGISASFEMFGIAFFNKTGRLTDPFRLGGALLDIGIYPVAYCHYLLGIPKSVECKGKLKYGVDICDKITLNYEKAVCKLSCSFVSLASTTAVIKGTKGKITVPSFFKATKAKLVADGKKEDFCDTVKKDRLYVAEFDELARLVREGKIESVSVPPKSTVEVMSILDTCRERIGLKYPRECE